MCHELQIWKELQESLKSYHYVYLIFAITHEYNRQ